MRQRDQSDPGYELGVDPEEGGGVRHQCGGRLVFEVSWLGVTLESCDRCRYHGAVALKIPVDYVRYDSRTRLDQELTAQVRIARLPIDVQMSSLSARRTKPKLGQALRVGRNDPSNWNAA